ncbi:sugar phosphate isomerase/epimerase [Pseudarthrobacter siccitolerans]|uniref:Sugar phosphate isomerase/epimerase n=1 Tax=Pseudarthrobacter siccitolerans TaxID=861266 RepID=A0ABU0PPP3_9MICC|nr:sugar phosphate isomerase/epimerase [Pseudarthrobacter siccitolerans]
MPENNIKLGVYTAVLHQYELPEALKTIKDLGLDGAEISAGGFIGTPHLPVADILTSDAAVEDYLGAFADAGITLTGLNVNGNPLHPDTEVREKHSADLQRSIEVAARLGVKRIVAMSGLPGGHLGATAPNWAVNPWDSAYLDILDYQWDIAVEYWKDINARAASHDVKVAIEMHPQNLVFNPATMIRLVERTGATHVGAEMDPSHLFWQGIDPVAAIKHLGPLVYHAAAKDTRINEACKINGVLDDRFRRLTPGEERLNIGGRYFVNEWPKNSSWDFVAVGRGHDVEFWRNFLAALAAVDPGMAVNIEHEDMELGRLEGLQVAAATLKAAL